MTYQPLHHKYRPQSFAELVGQAAIATTLSHALEQQRIAPAYLFTGARGTGKTSSARILAKSLNCLDSPVPTASPCGVCEVCRAIAAGSALDVIEIDAASNTGVDNIRELIERAQFAPVQCRYKVYIIDEVHMLSTAAFNALLKTLEEPPDRVVFVLATTDPQRVLPTIISRCQRFDFRRIPLEAMVQHLRAIADQETIPITDEAITLVAQISQGGLRDAESLLDQLSLLSGEIAAEQVWDLVGSVPERDLMTLLEAIATDHPAALLDSVRRLMDRGREPLIVLQNLASFYRDLLIAKTAPERGDLVAMTPDTWNRLCQFVQPMDLGAIQAGQQHLRMSEVQIKNTTQPRLWLEVTLMGLLPSALVRPSPTSIGDRPPAPQAQHPAISQPAIPRPTFAPAAEPVSPPPVTPPPAVSPGSETPVPFPPIVSPETTAHPPQPATLPPTATPPVGSPAPSTSSPDALEELWQRVLKQLHPPSTQMLLQQQGCLIGYQRQAARVGVAERWLKTVQTKLSNLETAFEKTLGQAVKVTLEAASPTELKSGREPAGNAESVRESGATYNGATPNSLPAPPAPEPLSPPAAYDPMPTHPSPIARETPHPPGSSGSAPISPLPEPRVPTPTPDPLSTPFLEDDVTRAAKNLADFFNGKVVDLSDASVTSGGESSRGTLSQDWEEPQEAEDEADVPF